MAKPDRVGELASDEDALRLVLAFYCIMEPEQRDQVMALAQRYASTPEPLNTTPNMLREPGEQ